MRLVEKERKKKFSDDFRSHSTWARKFQKKQKNLKNKKTPFRQYFQPKWDEIGGDREKKILDPNSVHTRPGQENSEKNRKKKSTKFKNLFLALFLAKTG